LPNRPRSNLLTLIFVLSGANGLCFEILWARQLQVVVGATSKAITMVVGLFMLGMAIGNGLGSRWAPHLRRPGFAYGAIEVGIGISAAMVTICLPGLENVGNLGICYALAALLVAVPSLLMGLTFPFVMQAANPQARAGGGALYAANTGGAALGCILAGFFGIGMLGIRNTAWVAASCNVICGLAACWLFRRSEPDPATAAPDSGLRGSSLVLIAAGLCGAGALAAELLWTRVLLPYVNSSSYAFAAIMVCFLAGLALGATWVAARCARLDADAIALRFVGCQVILAGLIAFSPRLMNGVESLVPLYVGIRRIQSLGDWLLMVAGVFAKSALVILPATWLMGASLPLCIALVARGGHPGSRAAGLVSAINTVGGVLGSVIAGFFLLPAFGSTNALLAVAFTNLVAALLVGLPIRHARGRIIILFVAIATAATMLIVARPAVTSPFLGRLAAGARVLLVDEGPQDTTAVIERNAGETRERLILSNGVSYAGDAPPAQRYMALLAHLPVLLSRDPTRVMVVCVGTGTTAANLATYSEVRVLDLVDISPAVHKTLPLFTEVNHRIWADPRATIHEADGRQFMTRTSAGYGVITLEPPPPRAAGAASLYTRELYQRARASMAPGGVMAQWLPLHGMTEAELLILARTFVQVFPESALFMLNPDEAALLGSPEPLIFDTKHVEQRLQSPTVRAALHAIGFASQEPAQLAVELLALAPVQGPALKAMVGEGPIVTDDQPLIEQFATLLGTQGRLDPDGRRGLLRRLAAAEVASPTLEDTLPALQAARQAMRAQINTWLQVALQLSSSNSPGR
jgi:spermidine synthase